MCVVAAGRSYVIHIRGTHSRPVGGGFGHFRNQFDSRAKRNGLARRAGNMKSTNLIGIVLIVLGALTLAYQGFTYTRQEKVLDVGPIHATAEKHEHVSIPPILGGLALIGGVAILLVGARKNS